MLETVSTSESLQGRIAVVTGTSGGIGQAVAHELVNRGATVACSYISGAEDPDALIANFAAPEGKLSAHPLDLRDPQAIRRFFGSVNSMYAGIDILVNNAAVGSATVARWASDASEQDTQMLTINADGTLKMCREFLASPGGAQRKLINLSSVGGGITAFPGFNLSDGMSKAAVAFLSRQLAAELVHADVDVFAVCPGATNTPMFQASSLQGLTADERLAFFRRLPKGRLIEPVEIARVIGFLAGPYSRVLHGAVIDASMGLGVRPGVLTESMSAQDE